LLYSFYSYKNCNPEAVDAWATEYGDTNSEWTSAMVTYEQEYGTCPGMTFQAPRAACEAPTPAPTSAAPAELVKVVYTLSNLNYSKVDSNATLKSSIIDGVKEGVLSSLTGYTKDDLMVALSAGSIIADVTITPKSGTTADALKSTVTASKGAMETSVTTQVTAVEGVDKALESGMTLSDVSASSVVTTEAAPTPAPPSDTSEAAFMMRSWGANTMVLVVGVTVMASSQ
jgi:hypothetical protein